MVKKIWQILAAPGLLLALLLVGCGGDGEIAESETAVIPTVPVPIIEEESEPETAVPSRADFIVIALDAPNPPFTDFDQFGTVIGINQDIMSRLASLAGVEYEFVVTPYEGVLRSLATSRDFDAVMTAPATIPTTPPENVVYTNPYLEVGQVVVVLADENEIQSHADLRPEMPIGVQANSSGEDVALRLLELDENNVYKYGSSASALQDLVDENVRAVIIDNFSADHFTNLYPEQLKIAGGEGRDGWITSKAYGLAIARNNQELLARLNSAIDQLATDPVLRELIVSQFLTELAINPGESRVGTPTNELVIGIIGQLTDIDPAGEQDLISWEVKSNTMSGLYRLDSSNQIVPLLAADFPQVSEDGLVYTISLRQGLRFPDGSELTAQAVKRSIDRSAGLGNFLVNSYLKDENVDGFADEDAVQVIDTYTVQILLQEPAAHFLSLLATPPYFPVAECFATTNDPVTCGGIGPYTVANWISGERLRLQANPQWPGTPAPAFENIRLRFYGDGEAMRRSLLEFQSIDLAWTGLPHATFVDLRQSDQNFVTWTGPAIFKSYVIFEQETPPWDDERVRRAFAYAVDRQALADLFAGQRQPLFSPVPDQVAGHTAVFPERDLAQAQTLLNAAGYSQVNPLPITFWYVNDGRYSPIEERYANTIKAQLEETGIFEVTLNGAPWEAFQIQINQCGYEAYLLGWPAPPTPGRPANYFDPSSWTDFFVENTDRTFCSNYESEAMTDLLQAARAELDSAARLEIYADIQQLWAEELPTLPLTQQTRYALSLPKVSQVQINALGLLHYELLTKAE
jgi:peptide/nickel transport system substrate-binding protein